MSVPDGLRGPGPSDSGLSGMTFGEGLPQTRPDGEASPYRFRVMAGDGAEETLSPAASLFDVEAPLAGTEAGEASPGIWSARTDRKASAAARQPGETLTAPPPAASTPWSRLVAPGRTACDAYPRCPYEGTGDDLKAHQRGCRRSEVGDLYRVLRGVA
jgi:hypothetical protein